MTKPNVAPEIIYDPSSHSRRSRFGASTNGRSDSLSRRHTDMHGESAKQDIENEEIDINKLLKDVQNLASSSMTWKERKKLENERVAALGGKALKKHRVPLSVGKFQFKKQKEREQKRMEEEQIMGRFTRRFNKGKVEKRRPEDRTLKASEGHFSKGVLNVKHLLERRPSEGNGRSNKMPGNGKKKGKNRGMSKGKGKKRGR